MTPSAPPGLAPDVDPPYPIWYVAEYPVELATNIQDWGFDARPWLRGLLADIKQHGLRNPLLIRGTEVQYGMNRVWCLRHAGIATAPAVVWGTCPVPGIPLTPPQLQPYFREGVIQVRTKGLRLYGASRPEHEWPHM